MKFRTIPKFKKGLKISIENPYSASDFCGIVELDNYNPKFKEWRVKVLFITGGNKSYWAPYISRNLYFTEQSLKKALIKIIE